MAQRAFVIGMIRRLRQLGPLPRRRRMPRQQQPDLIRLEYYKAVLPFVRAAVYEMEVYNTEVLRLLASEVATSSRIDGFAADVAKGFVARAREAARSALRQPELESVIERFAQRTSDFQRAQLHKQAVAALSVPLSLVEHPVVEKIGQFVKDNVALVRSVHERYFDRIEKDVTRAFEQGTHPREMAKQFVEREGMAKSDARRIARDQIGKLNAQVNEERQKGLGVVSYIWRTANDERVRKDHQEREGMRFDWDKPPPDGHPGEPVNCRCFADPLFDEILSDLTE
jgi:SPP1 gp7 family putative phage head morphogenesis protein